MLLKGLTASKRKSTIDHAVFSILIPSWNNLPYLQLCIDSIKKNSSYPHQIIVHVNQGNDGTKEWIEQQDELDYTYSEENIGICYALNYARTMACTDYIVYLNDDMYVCPQWDKFLFEEIRNIKHEFFFFSSTMIEPDSNNPAVINKNFGTSMESFKEQDLLDGYNLLKKEDWSGATWPPNVVHKNTWDLVGGYSAEFSPGMYSDPDFSMKLWQIGVRLFKGVASSRVYHFGGKSTGRVKKNKGYYTFIQKWGITPGMLTDKYLQRGMKYKGYLPEVDFSIMQRVKNTFKRLKAALR